MTTTDVEHWRKRDKNEALCSRLVVPTLLEVEISEVPHFRLEGTTAKTMERPNMKKHSNFLDLSGQTHSTQVA